MGLSVECIAMLEHMQKPAFFSENAVIIHANKAAELLGITKNRPLSEVLTEATTENEVFTRTLSGLCYTVSSSAIGSYKLYVLEQSLQEQHLQSLLRAAQHLRMPLAALTSSINSIMTQAQEQDDPEAIAIMQKATKQLFTLHRTVRNMSEVTDFFRKRYPKLEHINIFEYIREISEKLSANFEKSNVKITYSIADEDVYCNIDTELLERAIYNMISNALKAESHNIHIALTKTGKQLQLSISDDGHGMTNEEKAQILSKFKTEPTLNFEDRGLGLGMLIIHAAAIAHNGTVLITDAQPRGCKITLTLEIAKDAPVLRQNPVFFKVDPMGGIDSLMIELADFLPPEVF